MNVTIVDYQSGNISSVINSFTEVGKGKVNLKVTSDIKKIKSSDKIVLPGQGSFKSCVDSLTSISGLVDTLKEFTILKKKPLLGICVGLQMFADVGYEEAETKGAFDGVKLKTQNNFLKKFRLRSKKKEEMIDGEIEALKMTEKGNTKVGGILLSAISSKTLVDENEKNEN